MLPYPKAAYSPRDQPLFASMKDRELENPIGTRRTRRVQIIEPQPATPRFQRPNHFNIHEHLYELSTPNPGQRRASGIDTSDQRSVLTGSYANTYRNQQRRLQYEPIDQRSILNDYKTFLNNGGFGPAFGNAECRTVEEKVRHGRSLHAGVSTFVV